MVKIEMENVDRTAILVDHGIGRALNAPNSERTTDPARQRRFSDAACPQQAPIILHAAVFLKHRFDNVPCVIEYSLTISYFL